MLGATEMIEIWQPRWRDKVVLIAKSKVKDQNTIVFTKTPGMKGKYYLSGELIKSYPIDTNGRIPCYAVSLKEFK